MQSLFEQALIFYRLPLFERLSLSDEGRLPAFYAGANSIFIGDKLLTTPNVSEDDDRRILAEVSG